MYLLEHDAKELLAARGIAVPAGCLIESAAAARTACASPRSVDRERTDRRRRARQGRHHPQGRQHRRARGDTRGTSSARRSKVSAVDAVRIEQQVAGAARSVRRLPARRGERRRARHPLGAAAAWTSNTCRASRSTASSPRPRPTRSRTACASSRGTCHLKSRRRRADAGRTARACLPRAARRMLIEINPLFVYPDGRWIAGDAKIVTDDNALPRQKALESLVEARAAAYPDVARKHEHGFDYVVVDPEGRNRAAHDRRRAVDDADRRAARRRPEALQLSRHPHRRAARRDQARSRRCCSGSARAET